jgi:hypothetical protein
MLRRALGIASPWVVAAALSVGADAHALLFTASLTGAAERPTPNNSTATGTGSVDLNATEDSVSILLNWSGLTGPVTAAHIHGPADVNGFANVIPEFDFTTLAMGQPATGSLNGGLPLVLPITPAQVAELKAGLWYFNIHTSMFPPGEIRGQIVPEPGTMILLGVGLAGLARLGSRRARA